MAKKLRLAAAALTDIGRRRERNQDNETHFIPEDEAILGEKGALFVVCDGMGGHAAGEIASELGVHAIHEVYYSTDSVDVVQNLALAIRHANETIHTFAHEHPEKMGMGTTCVTFVVHGSKGYFLNIGDSRAYLIRNNVMRQITQDHSWVAEQVRAGLLTEEQARTHAHRNVITRSLGTQPHVTADLFIEQLRMGDRVLLCSDGLHGYVDEQEIVHEMLTHEDPQAGVAHLIDMANENGGPDNITATIVHILDVPESIEDEPTTPLDLTDRTATQPILVSTGPSAALKGPERSASRRQNGRSMVQVAAAVSLRLLAVAAMLLLAAGIWDFGFGPYAVSRAATTRAQHDIARAHQIATQSTTQDPAEALTALAQVRQALLADAHNPATDPQAQRNAQSTIATSIVPAVQKSIQRYNSAALITLLPPESTISYTINCTGSSQSVLTNVRGLAALPAGAAATSHTTQPVFVLNGGDLYQVNVPLNATGTPAATNATCAAVPVGGTSATLAIAADGSTLYTLSKDSTGTYSVYALTAQPPTPGAPPKLTSKALFQVPVTSGATPLALAVSGTDYYIGYSAGNSPGGIWMFSGQTPKTPSHTVMLPNGNNAPSVSALASARGTIFALLSDGSLGQIDSAHNYLPLPVTVMSPVIEGAPSTYTSATPVPTLTPATAKQTTTTGAGATVFPAGAALAGLSTGKPVVLVGDSAGGRVITFAPGATPGLQLTGQYIYGANLPQVAGLAAAPAGASLTVYVWSGSRLAAFSVTQP